jgi:hypothetical protein
MRGDLADRIREATEHEAAEQAKLFGTNDFLEGGESRFTATTHPGPAFGQTVDRAL